MIPAKMEDRKLALDTPTFIWKLNFHLSVQQKEKLQPSPEAGCYCSQYEIEKAGFKSQPTANEAKLGRLRQLHLCVTCKRFLDVCFYLFVYQYNLSTVNNRL